MPSITGETMSEAHDEHASSDPRLPMSETYDWSAVTPTTAVVELVSTATGHEPTDLNVLQDAVDSDALNALVEPTQRNTPREFNVTFEYHGYTVVVEQTGRVTLLNRGQ